MTNNIQQGGHGQLARLIGGHVDRYAFVGCVAQQFVNQP